MYSSRRGISKGGATTRGGKYCQVCIAVRFVHPVEVFGQNRVRAIRHAILPQISGLQLGRYYFQRTYRSHAAPTGTISYRASKKPCQLAPWSSADAKCSTPLCW